MLSDPAKPQCQSVSGAAAPIGASDDRRSPRVLRRPSRTADGRNGDARVDGGLAPVVAGPMVRHNSPAPRLSADLSPARQRVARTARARNLVLLCLGYPERVPYCELEGESAPKARRAYLCGADVGFTRTDRSMAVRNSAGGWCIVVDDWSHPAVYPTKAAALTAARKAEQASDARAKSAATLEVERRIGWMRKPDVRAWARQRDVDDAAETIAGRIAGRNM